MTEATQHPPKQQRLKRRWLRRLLLLAVVVIVIVVGAYFTVTSSWFIRNVAIPRVASQAGVTMTVEEVEFSPFEVIGLYGVRIIGPAPENDSITLDSISVSYSLGVLLGDQPAVEALIIQGADAELTIREDGTVALLSGLPPSGDESATEFQIEIFELMESNVSLTDHSIDPDEPLIASVQIGEVTAANLNPSSGLEELTIALSEIAVSQGDHTEITSGALDMTGEFRLPPEGGVEVNAQGTAGGFVGTWRGTPVDEMTLALSAATKLENQTEVTIEQCEAVMSRGSSEFGRVVVSGEYDTGSGDGTFHLNLADFTSDALELVMARPGGIDFGDCLVAGDLDLSLRDGGMTVHTEGSLNVNQLTALVPEVSDQRTPPLDLVVETSNEIDLELQTLRLTALDAHCEMDGRELLTLSLARPAAIAWGEQSTESIPSSSVTFDITQLDLARIRPLLPPDVAGQVSGGVVDAAGQIEIATGGQEVAFVGRLSAVGMAVAPGGGEPLPALDFQSDLNLTADLAGRIVSVERGDVSIQRGEQSGSFSAEGSLVLAPLDGTFEIQTEGLDLTLPLTLLSSVLGEEFPVVRGGEVTTDLTVNVADGGSRVGALGSVSWANLDVVIPQLSERPVPVQSGSVEIAQGLTYVEGRLEINQIDIDLGPQRGSVTVADSHSGDIRVVARELAVAPFVQYLGEVLPIRIDDGEIDGEGRVVITDDGIRVDFEGREDLRDWGLPGVADAMMPLTAEGEFILLLQGAEVALPTLDLALTSDSESVGSVNGSATLDAALGSAQFEGNIISLDVDLIRPFLPETAMEAIQSGRLTWGGSAEFTPSESGWTSSADGRFAAQSMTTSHLDDALDVEGEIEAAVISDGDSLVVDLQQCDVSLVADGVDVGDFTATGNVALTPLVGSLDVTLRDASLGPFLALVPLEMDTAALSGLVANGQQAIAIDLSQRHIDAEGNLALRNALQVETPQGAMPLSLDLRNRVEMSETGIEITDTEVVSSLGSLPPQTITLSADVDFEGQRTSRFDLAGDEIDLTPFVDLFQSPQQRAAASNGLWSMQLPDLPDPGALDLDGHLEFERVQWGELDVRSPSLDLAWSRIDPAALDRQLIISDATLDIVGPVRTAPATGEVLLMQGAAGSPLEYSLNIELGMCDFEALTSTFAPGLTESARGAFAVDRCQLSGVGGNLPRDLSTLQGGIAIQFGEGEFSELPLLDALVKATGMSELDQLRFFQGGVVLRPSGDHMRIDATQPFWVRGDLSLVSATGRVYYTGYQELSISAGFHEDFPRLGSIMQSVGDGLVFPRDRIFPRYLMFPLPIESSGTWSDPRLTLGLPRLDLLLPGVINDLLD